MARETGFAWDRGVVPSTAAAASPRAPKKRVKVPPPPPSARPHDCAVFGVDPAETSGYAMWSRGRLLEYAECDVFGDAPVRALERFLALPGPHVVVLERPFRVRYANQTGIGTAERIWRELAKRLGFGRRIVRVYPPTWRARTLGKGWASAKRERVREHEQGIARAVVLEQLGPRAPELGPESAPAVLIGKWGSHAGEVLKVLPKRQRTSDPHHGKERG